MVWLRRFQRPFPIGFMFPFRDMGDLDQNPLSLFRCIGYDLRVKNDMIPTTLQDLPVLLVLLCSSLAVGQVVAAPSGVVHRPQRISRGVTRALHHDLRGWWLSPNR